MTFQLITLSLSACFLSDMGICHHLLVTRGKTRQEDNEIIL